MLGHHGTVRERSVSCHIYKITILQVSLNSAFFFSLELQKTDASLHPPVTSSSIFEPFSPPVPPLPSDVQRNHVSSSPIADVFSTQGPSKPLPRIVCDSTITDRHKGTGKPANKAYGSSGGGGGHAKRRSMSVSETELKNPKPPAADDHETTQHWDATLNGIISDFKGELGQLDPVSGSLLDLQDPSRRVVVVPHRDHHVPPSPSGSSKTPTVILRPSPQEVEQVSVKSVPSSPIYESPSTIIPSTIVPPRHNVNNNTPWQTPFRAHTAPQPSSSKGSPTLRSRNVNSFGGLGTQINTTSRETSRLRVQHRSTASNSEPSLVREVTESRVGKSKRLSGKSVSRSFLSSRITGDACYELPT